MARRTDHTIQMRLLRHYRSRLSEQARVGPAGTVGLQVAGRPPSGRSGRKRIEVVDRIRSIGKRSRAVTRPERPVGALG